MCLHLFAIVIDIGSGWPKPGSYLFACVALRPEVYMKWFGHTSRRRKRTFFCSCITYVCPNHFIYTSGRNATQAKRCEPGISSEASADMIMQCACICSSRSGDHFYSAHIRHWTTDRTSWHTAEVKVTHVCMCTIINCSCVQGEGGDRWGGGGQGISRGWWPGQTDIHEPGICVIVSTRSP